MPGSQAVQIEGLPAFRRSLRAIDRSIDVDLRKELAGAAGPIRDEAARRAPRRTGALSRSLKISVRASGIAIRSSLPYARVVHGTAGITGPRPVRRPFNTRGRSDWREVSPRPFITDAVEGRSEALIQAAGEAVEMAARKAGWR